MVPAPKQASSGRSCETPTLLSGRYLKHYPQYFPPDRALPLQSELSVQTGPECESKHSGEVVPSMPVVPAGCGYELPSQAVPQSWTPPKPMNVPFGDFGMMADVFGQMLDAKVPPMPAPLPIPMMRIPNPPPIETAEVRCRIVAQPRAMARGFFVSATCRMRNTTCEFITQRHAR